MSSDNIEGMLGKVFNRIKVEDDRIIFCFNGGEFSMYHEQDCCEDVHISEIVGDISDLLNTNILDARCESGEILDAEESGTWTFYILRTIKGGVTIRWNGYSNGYYSEEVTVSQKLY